MSVTNEKQVRCPQCDELMIRRKSARGEFWGCCTFPRCRGTRQVGEEEKHIPKIENKYEPITKVNGSDEQEAIWAYSAPRPKTHVVVNAGPGSGKTFSSVQLCLRLPKDMDVRFVAFNKHIAREITGKLTASKIHNVKGGTFHGMGYGVLRQHFKKLGDPDDAKMRHIFETLCPMPLMNKADWRRMLNLAEKLAGYAKNYLINRDAPNFVEEMERVADHHGVDMNGSFKNAVALVPPALEECVKQADVCVDFDDMIWLPIVMNLSMRPSDIVITDESQDLNLPQHEMTFKAAGKEGRIIVVGDRHQAIYGFRGASTESIEALSRRLAETPVGVRSFPLTITRRCPQLHVRLAQSLFPNDIQAMPDAPLGEILQMPYEKSVLEMRAGDMVICRVNRELVACAYALIRRGLRPQIKGREIGKGLLQLVDLLEKSLGSRFQDAHQQAAAVMYKEVGVSEMTHLQYALDVYEREQEEKLIPLGDKAEGRLGTLHDKCDCLREFILNSSSVVDMRQRIEAIFTDQEGMPSNVVTLGTVHRTKGLESARIFVLAPDLIPHPGAKKDWEREQEKHIAWIAATRAKYDNAKGEQGTIVFCGRIPPIYGGAPPKVEVPTGSTADFSLEHKMAFQGDPKEKHEPTV